MGEREAGDWLEQADFFILGVLSLLAAFFLSCWLRFGDLAVLGSPLYRNLTAVLAVVELLVSAAFGEPGREWRSGRGGKAAGVVRHVLFVELLSVAWLFFTKEAEAYSRAVCLMTGVFSALFRPAVWMAWSRMRRRFFRRKEISLLLVSTEAQMPGLLKEMKKAEYESCRIAGLVAADRDRTGEVIEGTAVVSSLSGAAAYVNHQWVDAVLFFLTEPCPEAEKLSEALMEMGVTIHRILPAASKYRQGQAFVEPFGDGWMVTVSPVFAAAGKRMAKRAMDIAGGFVGCVFTGLLTVILGPAIFLQSPGPVFFSQVRVGKNGRPFRIYKFRSMYMDAESRKEELAEKNRLADGRMFKLDWDPRIIGARRLPDGSVKKGVGNLIREWSLDEFPQFFNVLKGDMSLVGTRPPTVDEWEKYEIRHRGRLAVKPGITGLWQVSGRNRITDFDEVVRLDKKYISEWSLGLDLRILLKTILVVLSRDGAM